MDKVNKQPVNPSNNKVKIILIQAGYPTSPFPPYLPIGLGCLSQQLEDQNIEYKVLDFSLNSKNEILTRIETLKPEYIGYSLMSLDLSTNYSLMNEIKEAHPDIKIVAGGPHIGFIGSKALEDCKAIDFGIVHEGEDALIELIDGRPPENIKGIIYREKNGTIVATKSRGFIQNLDTFPFPKYSKFELEKYGQVMQIASSRGCPHKCTFCGASLSMGKKWRARGASNVVDEIVFWNERGYKSFNFVDSNFFLSKKRVNNLCDSLEKKDINISISVDGMRLDDVDRDMLAKMKKFGLRHVSVGIESANDDTLAFIKKGQSLQDIHKGMEILKDMNISVSAFFVIGLPGETAQHIINSFAFALKYPNIDKCYFFNVNPLPSTKLFKFAEKRKMIIGSQEQLYKNIGGMGNDILMISPELSLQERNILLQYSKIIARSVELNHLLYESEKGRMSIPDFSAIKAETEILKSVSENYFKLLLDCKKPSPEEQLSLKHDAVGSKNLSKSVISFNISPIHAVTDHKFSKANEIFTHMTGEEKLKLYELAVNKPGKVYVEIGSYLGASSCFIAEAIKCNSVKKLYCVDTWENDAMSEGRKDTFVEFSKNISSYTDVIVPIKGKSLEVARTFDLGIDFLFLDADHSYDAVKADIKAWFPKLNPGALVILHDVGWAEGVKKAVKEFISPNFHHQGSLPNMCWATLSSPAKAKVPNTSIIKLSAIIPTRNRSQLLSRALESLTTQTYPVENFEVIVVDNGSSDKTRDVCRKFKKRIRNFNYLYISEPGLHIGRNAGCKASHGNILVYCDDDIRATADWLEGVADCFNGSNVALAGGNILPDFEKQPPGWFDTLWVKTSAGKVLGHYSLIDFGDDMKDISPMYVWGANYAIQKSVLLEAGGFHPDGMPPDLYRMRGDGETYLSRYIQKQGYKTIFNPKATVFHWISEKRMTLEYLYKRMFLQGISDSYTYIRNYNRIGDLKQYEIKTDSIQDVLHKAHCNGYNYHHSEVQNDPELLKWVLKDNYMDYKMTKEDLLYG